jgi:tetratricopeptide (TPR) repeat protein
MDVQLQTSSRDSPVRTSFGPVVPTRREVILLLALLLVAATVTLYEPSVHNGFINFDDPDYITENAHVQHGLSWTNVVWAFTTTAEANWHPLTWISLMASAQFFGLKPTSYHLVNMLLHSLNVILLFLLLQKATGYILRSGIVAALFAVFPLNVEAVAWATERKSVLSTACLFLALFAYGWYVRNPGIGRYLLLLLLFALGLLAKPMMITLPFVLLLLDYWPLKRIGVPGSNVSGVASFAPQLLRLAAEKIPLAVVSCADIALAFRAAQRGGALFSFTTRASLGLRVENAVWSYLAYILKGIWPSHLAIIYPFPNRMLPWWKVTTAGLVLLGITAAVWHYRERRHLLTGWLWYLGTLIPIIGIVQTGPQAMADRWAYVSFLGLFVMVVWLGAELAARIKLSRWVTIAITLSVLSVYAWVSHVQIGYWRNSYTVFSRALQVTTRNPISENDLGSALVEMGRPDLAMQHYEAAVRFLPQYSTAHYNLGILLQRQNKFDDAIREYELALAYTTMGAEAAQVHNNVAVLMLQLGRPAAALSHYNAALNIYPYEVPSLTGRGSLEYQEGNLNAAEKDFSQALLLTPSSATCYWLGRVLEDQGELKRAESAYETALKFSPEMNDARTHLVSVRRKLEP